MTRVSVTIPTYNERENLSKLVPLLQEVFESNRIDGRVIIVDDASPDGTGDVAEGFASEHTNIVVIHRRAKLGIGGAYKEGFSRALTDQQTRIIVEMDADFSHAPMYLPTIVRAAERCGGVALGSRYVEGGKVVGWSRRRRMVSWGANMLTRIMLGLHVKDATSGYRAYTRAALEAIGYSDAGTKAYAFQVEMLHRCARHGFPIIEVPITFYERQVGKSKLTRADILDFLRTVSRLGFKP
jgi:dolichol-phosphate mannosyltransferase